MRARSAAVRSNDDPIRDTIVAERDCAGDAPPSPQAATALDYDIVTTRSGFDNLASDWNALFVRAGNGAQAFQTFNWLWHWCNHYLDEASDRETLAIVTGRRSGRLVLVWPLVVERGTGVVKLTSMGAPVSQYSDALIEPSIEAPQQLRDAWDKVVSAFKPDLVWLPRVRDDAAIAPLMKDIGALATQRMEAPYIDLRDTPDLDTYMGRRSPQARKKHRAAERRMAKLGITTVEPMHGDGGSALAATTIAMKRRQLTERGLFSEAFADMRLRDFFSDAARGGDRAAGAQAIALQHDGEVTAANIVIGCRERVLGHVFTYDARFAKESIGAFLLHHTIGQAIAEGYKTFDLLSPADPYKLRCADGTVGVTNWAVPLTAKGTFFTRIYLMMARPMLKTIIERTPMRMRAFLAQRYYRGIS
ncbi:MAG: GNAT family N-acetyltransferase [Hyphomicrobium sp.]